jgi:Zn-dependent protease with chaperone function
MYDNRPRNPYPHNPHNPYQRRAPAGPRSWRQQVGVLAAALTSVAAWYFTPVSIWITDICLEQIPLDQDYQLGRQAIQEMEYQTIHLREWTPVLKSVTRDLVASLEEVQGNNYKQHRHWDVAIVHADFVNAFALPGGFIRVTDTLLKQIAPTKGELAALIGHEMGHVLHRHSQARLLQNQLLQYILKTLLLPEDESNRRRVPASFGEQLGEVVLSSAKFLGQQRFSRRDEYQADATSWDLLAVHNNDYNPQSLHSLLSKLWSLESASSGSSFSPLARQMSEWTKTHPATQDRLQALEKKWSALPTREQRRLSRNQI